MRDNIQLIVYVDGRSRNSTVFITMQSIANGLLFIIGRASGADQLKRDIDCKILLESPNKFRAV